MERDEVDALIAIYACVGDCDPDVVGRGIRRGVMRAERDTGRSQARSPVPHGRRRRGAAGPDHRATCSRRTVFPNPPRALSRAVQYAAFRRQPGGLITWYDDVDSGAARRQVTRLLDPLRAGPVLEGEKARESSMVRHHRRLRTDRSCGAVRLGRGPLRPELRAAHLPRPRAAAPGRAHHAADRPRRPRNRPGCRVACPVRNGRIAGTRLATGRGIALAVRHEH